MSFIEYAQVEAELSLRHVHAGTVLPVRMLDTTQDAFGRALVDHHEGRGGPALLLEGDDGALRPADLQPEDLFVPYDAAHPLSASPVAKGSMAFGGAVAPPIVCLPPARDGRLDP